MSSWSMLHIFSSESPENWRWNAEIIALLFKHRFNSWFFFDRTCFLSIESNQTMKTFTTLYPFMFIIVIYFLYLCISYWISCLTLWNSNFRWCWWTFCCFILIWIECWRYFWFWRWKLFSYKENETLAVMSMQQLYVLIISIVCQHHRVRFRVLSLNLFDVDLQEFVLVN